MGFIVVSALFPEEFLSYLHELTDKIFLYSRGQLGLGQLDSELIPVLVDPLAGVKVPCCHAFRLSC